MTATIDPTTEANLLADILDARYDTAALAAAHGLEPDVLAQWARSPQVRQRLTGLCLLADLQTQLMVSRYRIVVTGRLIRLATEEAEGDLARRACMDLLKLELERAEDADTDGTVAPMSLNDLYDTDELAYGRISNGGVTQSDTEVS